jgi:hypothetical protein
MSLWLGLAAGALAAAGACALDARAEDAAKPKEQPKVEYPQTTLATDALKLTIALPDAEKGFYRGTRFAWSGVILAAEFAGHRVFAPFRAAGDPANHDNNIAGPAEEFDLENPPPGYAEAKVGEPFVKIGVGVLEKPKEEKYGFWNTYKFAEKPEWKVTEEKGAIELRQAVTSGDWGYVYTKRIALVSGKPTFTITYTLKNTGRKAIDTLQYCHNFTIIDGRPVGPDYRILFPFDVAKPLEARGSGEYKGREIGIPKPLTDSIWAILRGPTGNAADNLVTIVNDRARVSVTITGDQPFVQMRFYAEKTAVCPEPFLRIKVAPGEEKTWRSEYALFVSVG